MIRLISDINYFIFVQFDYFRISYNFLLLNQFSFKKNIIGGLNNTYNVVHEAFFYGISYINMTFILLLFFVK